MEPIRSPNQKERCRLAQKYEILGKRPYLSNSDEICLGQILEVAQSDEILSNWLEQIDLKLGDALGILDENSEEDDEKIRRNLRTNICWALLEKLEA